jgi:hypothetical protein
MDEHILTKQEREKIEHDSQHGLCQCGHEKNSHSRFIDGMFKGCQLCNCQNFEWSDWTLIYTSPKYHYWKHTTTGRLATTNNSTPPEALDGTYYNLLPFAVSNSESIKTLKDIQNQRIF